MSRNNKIVLLVIAVMVAAFPPIARASLPVEFAIVGCIKGDRFYLNGAASRNLVGAPVKALDGKTIRVEGFLSPGDLFRAVALFVVDDRCLETFHNTYFLCDPCRTLEVHSPSRSVPRREGGVAVQMPPEVIRQFDNLLYQLRSIREE